MNRSLTAAFVAVTLLLAACGGPVGEAESPASEVEVRLEPMVLGSPIAGFSLNGAVGFPSSGEQSGAAYSFTLYQMPETDDIDLGIFRITSQNPGQAAPQSVHVGPGGLEGFFVDGQSDDLVLASRRMSSHDLRELAQKTPHQLVEALANSRTIAHQSAATIPGIGSLPIATQRPGYAVSYTKDEVDSATEDQVSIVIGAYEGASSDLRVLDWWFGSHETPEADHHTYTFPNLNAADDEPVAKATLDVWATSGIVKMIRTTGLSALEATASRDVRSATPSEWQTILSSVKD